MSWRKTLYNPEDPKDLEELMEYFHSLDTDDEVYSQIQDAESLEVALIPPEDGEDSDQDDAASDDDIIPNIRDLGKGILSQKVHIFAVNRDKEKSPITIQIHSSKQIHAIDESWDTSDDEKLADKQKRLKVQNRTSRKGGKRVKREWEEIIFESRDQKVELLDETRPAILTDILEKNMSPVDLFKTFFSDDIIAKICLETKSYADQKGFHGFSCLPDAATGKLEWTQTNLRRRIVIALLAAPPSSSSTGPKPKLPCKVLSEVRYDGKNIGLIDRRRSVVAENVENAQNFLA
nr:unnamed protein product [Callosobruchus chinensis]